MDLKVEIKMKQILTHKIVLKTLICMSLLSMSQAQAAMVQFTLSGQITSATNPNIFDVVTNELVTATGHFDDSVIGFGESIIDFSTTYNNMQISLGNTIYTDDMDLFNGAYMYFMDGIFDGIDYEGINGNFDSWGYTGQVGLDDFSGVGITGNWTASSFEVSAVPIPAAVWLFGSGLALLGGIARRSRSPHCK